MSEGRHTPAPWFLLTNAGQQRIFTFNHVIADVRKTSMEKSESRANALLIMSAPELLQALESLLAVVEQHDTPLSDPERIAARSAIAKAKGEA